MKQKINKILGNPKITISVALIVAVAIGFNSYTSHNKIQAERFDKVNKELGSIDLKKNITPMQDLTLAFPVGGRIKSVQVKIGDVVKIGTILASLDAENAVGAVNQAKAAYSSAQTAYEKLVNGTSTPDIEIARVALNNAKNSYNNTIAAQKVLVTNALSSMNNSGLAAISTTNSTTTLTSPTISGTYTGTEEGTYTITIYGTGNGNYFSASGLESGNGIAGTTAVPLGTRGLYIQFPNNFSASSNTVWTVSIPNTQSSSYLTYRSAYQSALQNQTQAITAAQGQIDTAQASLDQKISGARSEDLAIAKAQVDGTLGALQIAQGIYSNTIITAPANGTITNVTITAGQIATPNTPAIELLSQ